MARRNRKLAAKGSILRIESLEIEGQGEPLDVDPSRVAIPLTCGAHCNAIGTNKTFVIVCWPNTEPTGRVPIEGEKHRTAEIKSSSPVHFVPMENCTIHEITLSHNSVDKIGKHVKLKVKASNRSLLGERMSHRRVECREHGQNDMFYHHKDCGIAFRSLGEVGGCNFKGIFPNRVPNLKDMNSLQDPSMTSSTRKRNSRVKMIKQPRKPSETQGQDGDSSETPIVLE